MKWSLRADIIFSDPENAAVSAGLWAVSIWSTGILHRIPARKDNTRDVREVSVARIWEVAAEGQSALLISC